MCVCVCVGVSECECACNCVCVCVCLSVCSLYSVSSYFMQVTYEEFTLINRKH